MRALIVIAVLAIASTAHAYPQFQLSKDQTCTSCHLSPAGGGILNENGLNVIQATSWRGDDPTPFYGAVNLPSWFALGGDIRAAGGYYGAAQNDPNRGPVLFPMQAEVSGAARLPAHFSLYVTAGLIDPEQGPDGEDPNSINTDTLFASREHWVQWQDSDGGALGLFVRAGRFMPVFGLRFVEHVDFDRRYGGTPLYGEAYGVALEEIQSSWEVHATAFVHDPWQATTELGDGAAIYAEDRIAGTTAIGIEAKYDRTTDDRKIYAGVTAKHYFASLNVLVQGEGEYIHQQVVAGGANDQILGYLLGSYYLPSGFMIDLGLGEYEPDIVTRNLTQQVADLNIHWFATSHVELILTNRLAATAWGEGSPGTGYSLLQLHYRI